MSAEAVMGNDQLTIEQANEQLLRPIEEVERELLKLPQVEAEITHHFAPGVYCREILMKAGTFFIGQQHKTEHLNIVVSGRARVLMDGVVREIVGPCTLKSGVNVRKALLILQDMRWITVHPTEETDLEKLEELLITKSDAFLEHERLLLSEEIPHDVAA